MVLPLIAGLVVGGLLLKAGLDEWDRRRAEEHSGRGRRLHAQGLHADALREYAEAARLAPNNPEPHTLRGRALWALGRREDALGEYRTAVSLDADSAAAYCDVADALVRMGRPHYALASAERAVSLSRRSARARRIMGEALRDLGEGGKAIDALRVSADLHDTAGTRVLLAEVRCGRGEHVRERREMDRAIELGGGRTRICATAGRGPSCTSRGRIPGGPRSAAAGRSPTWRERWR